MPRSAQFRIGLLGVATVAVIAVVFLAFEPFPQPSWYHQFADQRDMFRIPNAMNVISNLPFLIVGLGGLMFLASEQSQRAGIFLDPRERWPFWVYFTGLALTALGSAYYHAAPSNERLVWDRLPLMATFMGLFASVLAERISVQVGVWSLIPLMIAGMGSVIQWHLSEQASVGDMRFYLVMQFYPILVLLVLLAIFPPKYTGAGELLGSLAAYGIAKILEVLDKQIYAQGAYVSGHTLKHLIAGLGAYLILYMLQRRKPVSAV